MQTFARFSVVLLAGALGVALIEPRASAQWLTYPTPGMPRTADGKPNLAAPAPRSSDGKVDLSGIWTSVRPDIPRDDNPVGPNLKDYMPAGATIPMQPWAEELFKERSGRLGAGRPSERCLPHSIPDAMLVGSLKFVQTPGLTILLYEEFNHFRQIFTDGRPLPPPLQPAWFGYSIGKWEGETLVVDSSGFNDQSWLDDWGHPHTDTLHTVERFRRSDYGHMEMEVTIDDPKAYTRPWSATVRFNLLADTEMIENICENEQDNAHTQPK